MINNCYGDSGDQPADTGDDYFDAGRNAAMISHDPKWLGSLIRQRYYSK